MLQQFKFTMLLIRYYTIETAQKLYCNSLLWKIQIFDCESYYIKAEVRQCYKCLQFGYHVQFCKSYARYSHCVAAVYMGKKIIYFQLVSSIKKRCMNCKKNHII